MLIYSFRRLGRSARVAAADGSLGDSPSHFWATECLCGPALLVRRCHGSVRQRPSLGSTVHCHRAPGAADQLAVRQAVCQRQKNDGNDAEAICEAMQRPKCALYWSIQSSSTTSIAFTEFGHGRSTNEPARSCSSEACWPSAESCLSTQSHGRVASFRFLQ